MSLNAKYSSALTVASACLAIKVTVVHLLTARERILADHSVTPNPDANKSALVTIFKVLLGCVPGTGLGGVEFIDRAERVAKNCAENEPFFLATATAALLSGSVPACLAVPLIQAYTAARCAHTSVYLLGDKVPAPLRPISYLVSVVTTFGMAGLALGLKKSGTSKKQQ